MRFAIILALVCAPQVARAQEALTQVQEVLERARTALSEEFAGATPLPAASAGVSYSFDEATGNFRRDPATFGQIYLDRADPLGRGRLNVSLTYQYTRLDSIEGKDADSLEDPLPLAVDELLAAIEIPHFGIKASVHSLMLAATYGVTEDLDASIAVPLLYSDVHSEIDVNLAFVPKGGDEPITGQDRLSDTDDSFGIGDVMLRAKYRLLALEQVHAAAGLMLRLPSGRTRHLQGLGYVEVAPALLASSQVFELASWARFQAHMNGTIAFNTDDVDASEGRWGLGFDWGINDSVTAALAFLGRHPFARIGRAGLFKFPRCETDLETCAVDREARTTTANLFGISGDRADSYTASIGVRGALWRDALFGFANLALPLNDGFLRMHPIPLIGLEATFG